MNRFKKLAHATYECKFDLYSHLKQRYWGRHFWAKGYCVSTVGLDEEQIKQYVQHQLEQDKKMEERKLWDE